jgi:peptidyl-prolyl cis-trans isomerase C
MFSPLSPKHSLRPLLFALALAAPATINGAAAQQAPALQLSQPDPVVATVNGKPIHKSDIAADQRALGQQAMQVPLEKIFPQLVNRHVQIMLLADAATAEKLQDDPDVKAKIVESDNQILAQTYATRIGEKAVTDDALHAAYQKAIAAQTGTEEVHARHILVKTEAEAKAIIAQLDKGGDFAKIANAKTTDPSGKTSGGDLGWFSKDQMVAPFSDAAFKLKKNEYTKTPVQTQFGFHVIQLLDRRVAQPKTFDEMKGELRQEIGGTAVQAKLDELKTKAKVEEFNIDGKPITPEAAPAAAAAKP